jgi:hypothetical protein
MDDFRNSATTLYSNGSTSYDLGKSLQLYSRGLSTVQGIVLTKTTCTVTQQTQWIAKQQLDRQGTKCFWRGPVGQQKSAQRHEGTNVPSCGVLAGTEDDRLRLPAAVNLHEEASSSSC